jgi:hypothetical protein
MMLFQDLKISILHHHVFDEYMTMRLAQVVDESITRRLVNELKLLFLNLFQITFTYMNLQYINYF